jgi:hypothetical protein
MRENKRNLKKIRIEICEYSYNGLKDFLFRRNINIKKFITQIVFTFTDLIELYVIGYYLWKRFDYEDGKNVVMLIDEWIDLYFDNKEDCYVDDGKKKKKYVKRLDIELLNDNKDIWDLLNKKIIFDDFSNNSIFREGIERLIKRFKNKKGVFKTNEFINFLIFFYMRMYLVVKNKIGIFKVDEEIKKREELFKKIDIENGIIREDEYYKIEAFTGIYLHFKCFGNLNKLIGKELEEFININDIENYYKNEFDYFNNIKIKNGRDFKNIRKEKELNQFFNF